jgi:hypothetical protein
MTQLFIFLTPVNIPVMDGGNGKKLNCRALPKKYQKSYSVDGDIRTCIYQDKTQVVC